MMNPFKFGSVVSDDFFTNRKVEYERLSQIMASSNHDNDFERLWNHFNNTDKKVLIDPFFRKWIVNKRM